MLLAFLFDKCKSKKELEIIHLVRTRVYAYQGVRDVSFSENLSTY